MTASKKYRKVTEATASLRRETLPTILPIVPSSTVGETHPIASFTDFGDYLISLTPTKVPMERPFYEIDLL